MSTEHYSKNINYQEAANKIEATQSSKKVNVTDLVTRMNEEKKKERNSNIILSAAAVSAVTVFGIILTL